MYGRSGAEEKLLCALKQILPYQLFKSHFDYPIEGKQLNKAVFTLNMV